MFYVNFEQFSTGKFIGIAEPISIIHMTHICTINYAIFTLMGFVDKNTIKYLQIIMNTFLLLLKDGPRN